MIFYVSKFYANKFLRETGESQPMQLNVSAASDVGRVREQNEDYYLIDEELNFFIVCDGMGGHAAGEVAAQNAAHIVANYLRGNRRLLANADKSPDGHFRVLQIAEDAVEFACAELYSMASSQTSCAGMGTTLTMLIIVDDKAVMAHVGDSQLYLARADTLHLLSTDHTLANELVMCGKLSPLEGQKSRYNNILTRSLGPHESVQVETLLFDLAPGDVLLLCSDGLTKYFEHRDEMAAFLAEDPAGNAPARLIDIANSRGGADNITAVVISVMTSAPQVPAKSSQDYSRVLRSVFLFGGLSLGRLLHVLNGSHRRSLAVGEALLRAGDRYSTFYVVLDGRIASRSRAFGVGESFGAQSLYHASVAKEDIVAVVPTLVMAISSKEFRSLTQRFPRLGRRLLSNLASYLSKELQRRLDRDFADSDTWVEPD